LTGSGEVTGNRGQGTGDRGQGTGDRGQGTGTVLNSLEKSNSNPIYGLF